jgi:hypothetical protein
MRAARHTAGNILLFAALVLAANDATAQAPVQSCVDLAPLVKAGQDVVVWDRDGRKIRGRLVVVNGDTLEIRRPPRFAFGSDRRQVFMEASVSRVDHRDSTTKYGGLLGLVAGLAVSVAAWKTATGDDWNLPEVVLAPVIGPLIGAAIDGAINRSIYTSPTATKRVTVAPALRRTAGAGVYGSISF